jgi:hypothetical protein
VMACFGFVMLRMDPWRAVLNTVVECTLTGWGFISFSTRTLFHGVGYSVEWRDVLAMKAFSCRIINHFLGLGVSGAGPVCRQTVHNKQTVRKCDVICGSFIWDCNRGVRGTRSAWRRAVPRTLGAQEVLAVFHT